VRKQGLSYGGFMTCRGATAVARYARSAITPRRSKRWQAATITLIVVAWATYILWLDSEMNYVPCSEVELCAVRQIGAKMRAGIFYILYYMYAA